MAAELPRPGVEVIQVFQSVSPTVVTPTLVPCIVGVCKQIVDVLVPTSAGTGQQLNSSALISLPAQFLSRAGVGDPPVYAGLGGLQLVVSINHGTAVTVVFPVSPASLSLSAVVNTVNTALTAAGVTSAIAEVAEPDAWRLRTLGVGPFQTIEVDPSTSPAVASAFGLVPVDLDDSTLLYAGKTSYVQHQYLIPQANFPNPNNNLADLGIDNASIRAFLALGNGTDIREMLRTESFLRRGGGNAIAATPVVGIVDLVAAAPLYGPGGTLDGKTLTLNIDTVTAAVTFTAPANAAAVLAAINAVFAGTATLGGGNVLTLTSSTTGGGSIVAVISGGTGVLAGLGLVAVSNQGTGAISAVDPGTGSAVTPVVRVIGGTFTTAASTAQRIGTIDLTAVVFANVDGTTLELSINGEDSQTLTFPVVANAAAILTAINNFFPGITATMSGPNFLTLTTTALGDEARIEVVGGTSLVLIGLTTNVVRGTPFPPKPNDQLFIDGVVVGTITQVAPGGVVTDLKIDKFIPVNPDIGTYWFILAENLTGSQTATRPSADLIIDLYGNVRIKHEILRDINGVPLTGAAAQASVYLSYEAVRRDVTSKSSHRPSLLRFNSTTELSTLIPPVTPQNPLALGTYFALLNAPGVQVAALGVDAISANAPLGTVEAFTAAAEFLEAFEVYAIAPLTHDSVVAQVFNTHVSFMSSPEQKGERIVLFNPTQPLTRLDTLVASGQGNSSAPSTTNFDTGAQNLGALVLAADVDPVGTIPTSAGLFLKLASSSLNYSISSINGSIVTIRTSFGSGENDDGFYSTTDLVTPPNPSVFIDELFSVKVRGEALVLTDGSPDRQAIAETYQAMGQSYLNRRFWHVVPDACTASIEGLVQTIDGFYMTAAIAGMIGAQPPQQSFTNFPMTGFLSVIGSNDQFSEKQLNIMAAGGNYIIVQDTQGAPLISRMALTTDLTSIETRTDSITKVVDFTAKFLRVGLKNFIGRFNITQGLLDSLSHVIQGLLGFLADSGVLIGSTLNNIIQDTSAPDTVLVDVTLDVPYPCNYIRLTVVILG